MGFSISAIMSKCMKNEAFRLRLESLDRGRPVGNISPWTRITRPVVSFLERAMKTRLVSLYLTSQIARKQECPCFVAFHKLLGFLLN